MLWGVALLPLAFWPPFEDAFKLPQSIVIGLLGGVTAVGLLSRVRPEAAPSPLTRPHVMPVLALIAWIGLAGPHGAPIGGRALLIATIFGLGMLPAILDRQALATIPPAAFLAGVASGLYSLAQYAGIDFAGAPGAAGLRPFSTMGNPDFLAAYLVAVLPVGVAWWVRRPSVLKLAGCLVVLAALLIAQSRGAWLGILAAALVAGGLGAGSGIRIPVRQILKAAAGAAVIGAAFFGLSGQARERLAQTVSIHHFDAAGRLFMWRATMGMIRDRPLTGGGWGAFGSRYPTAHASTAVQRPGVAWFWSENSHNDYFQIAADLGVLGLGLFAWIWTRFVLTAFRLWKRGDLLALGVLAGFVAVQVDACFNFPWYLLPVQGWFWFSWAWLGSGGAPRIRGGGTERWGLATLPVVGMIAACSLVWSRDLEANHLLKLSGDAVAAARWPEARVCAERSMERWMYWENPQRAANNAALAAYSLGDFPAAEAYARRSLAWFPDQPGALNQLGLALARQGKTAEAGEAARRALALNPRQAESWHLLGNLAYLAGDTRSATACWTAALRENPNLPGLRESLAALARGGAGARPGPSGARRIN